MGLWTWVRWPQKADAEREKGAEEELEYSEERTACLLYTSDAADEDSPV